MVIEKAKQAEYQAKYMKRHQMVTFNLDKKEDAKIIKWLNKQGNKSKAIRAALLKVIDA